MKNHLLWMLFMYVYLMDAEIEMFILNNGSRRMAFESIKKASKSNQLVKTPFGKLYKNNINGRNTNIKTYDMVE